MKIVEEVSAPRRTLLQAKMSKRDCERCGKYTIRMRVACSQCNRLVCRWCRSEWRRDGGGRNYAEARCLDCKPRYTREKNAANRKKIEPRVVKYPSGFKYLREEWDRKWWGIEPVSMPELPPLSAKGEGGTPEERTAERRARVYAARARKKAHKAAEAAAWAAAKPRAGAEREAMTPPPSTPPSTLPWRRL